MSGIKQYMVHVGPTGSVFIKDRDFFEKQGGFKEPWGKSWVSIEASGRREASRIACETLSGTHPYSRQAIAHDFTVPD